MKKQLLTAALALALTFTLGCGNHTWDDYFSCLDEEGKDIFDCSLDELWSVVFDSSSSSSEKEISSSSDKYDPGPLPPDDPTPTPSSNSQGTAIVGPLLKTQWGKGTSSFNPFNILPDGQEGWIDCGVVAQAQLMKYHNFPKRGSGQTKPCNPCTWSYGKKVIMPSVSLDVDYDWSNMLNTYVNANANEQQQKAILTLLHHVGLIRFTGDGSFLPFGYDKSLQTHYRKYYTDSAWAAMIKKQLDSGLPIAYYGKDSTISSGEASSKGISGGHVYIIDGYDSKGKFHVNWGWGGSKDGYYSLDSLNPGHSQYPTGFSYEPYAIINIQPDKSSIGSNEMALDSFTIEKTSISQYEQFNIKARIKSFGTFPNGQAGAALIDNTDNIAKVIGIRNFTSSYNMEAYVPEDVNPGQYKLRIVTRFEGGQWKKVTLSDRKANIPNFINLTVNQNLGAPGGGYGLYLMAFSSEKTNVQKNELFGVSVQVKNQGEENFPGGQIGVALVDNAGNIVSVIETMKAGSLDVGYRNSNPKTINCKVPETVPSGKYRLRIVVRPDGNDIWRVATMATDGAPTAIDFTVKQ